jgi:hypothetical protein
MYVHLFNWPVSPSVGWADPVKITASGGVLNFKDLYLKNLTWANSDEKKT